MVSEIPSKGFNGIEVLECIGKQDFAIVYDFSRASTLIGIDASCSYDTKERIRNRVPGIAFKGTGFDLLGGEGDYSAFSVYREMEEEGNRLFHDAFNTLPGSSFIAILFVNSAIGEIAAVKLQLEDVMSSKSIRKTEPSPVAYSGSRSNSTVHRDLYYESEEKVMLNSIIGSLNNAILSNGLAYKIFVLIPKDDLQLSTYINTHFLVLAKHDIRGYGVESVMKQLSKIPSIPFGAIYAGEFLNFYGFLGINHAIRTSIHYQEGGIEVGKIVKDGVAETDISAKIDPSAINLGFLITGLPGSGKTMEAMSIVDSLLHSGRKPAVFIVTPTKEWGDFALSHNMPLICLYNDDIPMNFFRCPDTIGVEKFYGNLAMILSSAANAGPYRNPIEKCMLNAFRYVYSSDRCPEPVNAYNEIERSIIKYHGKVTPGGIKYTKHGENIKSSLENLRGILSKGQYCVKDGIRIEDFMESGAVFDISGTTSNTMVQLYALVLNQIYSLASNFDESGDSELRLVICLEEAQIIFGDERSPAVQDIKQRIQDFRKKGIGLILLTHTVGDIEVGIRRLCQLKLYLKQAPDTAIIASKDLIFAFADQDDIMMKLKTLPSRVGAFNYISKDGFEKRQHDTMFIKTGSYEHHFPEDCSNPIKGYVRKSKLSPANTIKCRMIIKPADYQKLKGNEIKEFAFIRLCFLGEELETIALGEIGARELSLLDGAEYTICVLNRNKRILKEFAIRASRDICLDIF
ncbi:MAG: hypothetical protein ACREBH_02695 [Candidatus Micrarchaeaceae archaeon]